MHEALQELIFASVGKRNITNRWRDHYCSILGAVIITVSSTTNIGAQSSFMFGGSAPEAPKTPPAAPRETVPTPPTVVEKPQQPVRPSAEAQTGSKRLSEAETVNYIIGKIDANWPKPKELDCKKIYSTEIDVRWNRPIMTVIQDEVWHQRPDCESSIDHSRNQRKIYTMDFSKTVTDLRVDRGLFRISCSKNCVNYKRYYNGRLGLDSDRMSAGFLYIDARDEDDRLTKALHHLYSYVTKKERDIFD